MIMIIMIMIMMNDDGNQVDVDGSGAVEWDEFCVLMYRKVVFITIITTMIMLSIIMTMIMINIIISAEDHLELSRSTMVR